MDLALVFRGCHRQGGVERLVYEAARHFADRHQVTVYAESFEEEGLEAIQKQVIPRGLAPSAMRVVDFSRRVRRVLEERSHDHVISFGVADVDPDVLWVNSIHAAWLERPNPVAGDYLRSSPLRRFLPRHQVMLAMERRYFTQARNAVALVVSEHVGLDLERIYGFPLSKAVVVHNGYDPDEFSHRAVAGERAAVRAELGIPSDAVVLLLVANELARKGFRILLEAAATLPDPRVHVLLVGRADPASQSDRIGELGLRERFHYGGSRSDLGRIHRACDLFVLPTRYEAFSLAVVEALASGLPVITSDVPGARDLVVDGVNGRLQRDPASSAELASLLAESLADDRYRDWAQNAAESVRDHAWPRLLDGALSTIERAPQRLRAGR